MKQFITIIINMGNIHPMYFGFYLKSTLNVCNCITLNLFRVVRMIGN